MTDLPWSTAQRASAAATVPSASRRTATAIALSFWFMTPAEVMVTARTPVPAA